MNLLTMPLEVYYTKSWTLSEVFGTLSYTRQWFEILFKIKIVENLKRLPHGHAAEAVDMTDTAAKEWDDAFYPTPKPPLRVYFVEFLIMKKFSVHTATKAKPSDYGGIAFMGMNVAVIDRDTLVKRFGKHHSLECSRTMAHELGHLLGLKHLQRPSLTPNLLATEATSGKRPKFAVTDMQVNSARQYGLSRKYLK